MKNTLIIRSLLVGISIIITAFILGKAFKNRNAHTDSISVIGLGTQDFTSDEIYFSGSYSYKAMDAKEAYDKINEDFAKVKTFFSNKGFKPGEVVYGGITFTKNTRTITTSTENGDSRSEEVFDGYTATQTVSITAKGNPGLMKKIEDVSDQTSELINSGIQFEPNQLQYTFSKLQSLKYTLIEKATEDAHTRVEKIVEKGDGSLGKLKNATTGVFQINAIGSNDEDSYGGNYDIYSKEKQARVTVRLEYELD